MAINAIDVLLKVGVFASESLASTLIPAAVSMTPLTSQPSNPMTMKLVEGLQTILNKKKYGPLAVDGIIGPATKAAASSAFGPLWDHETWISLFTKSLSLASKSVSGNAGGNIVTDQFTGSSNTLLYVGVAVAGAYLLGFFGKGK